MNNEFTFRVTKELPLLPYVGRETVWGVEVYCNRRSNTHIGIETSRTGMEDVVTFGIQLLAGKHGMTILIQANA